MASARTTFASGVDGSVLRIDTAYNSQDHPFLVTSDDSATAGSILN